MKSATDQYNESEVQRSRDELDSVSHHGRSDDRRRNSVDANTARTKVIRGSLGDTDDGSCERNSGANQQLDFKQSVRKAKRTTHSS